MYIYEIWTQTDNFLSKEYTFHSQIQARQMMETMKSLKEIPTPDCCVDFDYIWIKTRWIEMEV